MLYIKFEIQDSSKFEDFQKLFDHMVRVRQPGFEFDDEGPEFNWDNMPKEEYDAAMAELNEYLDQQVEPEKHRCKELLPNYVNEFLESYLQSESENLESFGSQSVFSIFDYLEFGFEVDMDNLKKINERFGIVEFSTGNYPFGGMERFIMTLAAYNLKPVTCFDGFNDCKFSWTSRFEYDVIILPKKQSPFQHIKNWISKSFLKKSLLLIPLLISNNGFSQFGTSELVFDNSLKENKSNKFLVLEKPEFPSPENENLFLLSEVSLFDLRNYAIDVKEVAYEYTVYNPDKTIKSVDSSRVKSGHHLIKNPEISEKRILDCIGIDSISKKGNTVQLFHFDEEADYSYQVYELKNEQIISADDNTSVKYYNTNYTYDNSNNLLKAETIDDYGNRELETATYNENGFISSKKKFEISAGIDITTTNYTYNNGSLTAMERRSVTYFVPLDQVKIPLENIDYSAYMDGDTSTVFHTLNFAFNENSKLVRVEETTKGFSENEGIYFENAELFTLDHKPDKLIVHADLPKKTSYEYIFDAYGNPKEIYSYVVEPDNTWLEKKILFKVSYIE